MPRRERARCRARLLHRGARPMSRLSPLQSATAALTLLALAAAAKSEEPAPRVQEARRAAAPAMTLRLMIGPSAATLAAPTPYAGEVGLEARDRPIERARNND